MEMKTSAVKSGTHTSAHSFWSFSNLDKYGNENVKNNWFYKQKNNSARASHFLILFEKRAGVYYRREFLNLIIHDCEFFERLIFALIFRFGVILV